jgi:hypothetical protein
MRGTPRYLDGREPYGKTQETSDMILDGKGGIEEEDL